MRDHSWQGVGIASHPRKEPAKASLRMLEFLEAGNALSLVHEVIVADAPQVHNYTSMYGLSERRASKRSRRNGERRLHALREVAQAYDLDNLSFSLASDMHDELATMTKEVYRRFELDAGFRKDVFTTIPARLRKRGGERLANYTLNEIALSLHKASTRLNHTKQRHVDALIVETANHFGVPAPEFIYHSAEFIPSRKQHIEPYSNLQTPERIYVGDSPKTVRKKRPEDDAAVRKLQPGYHAINPWPRIRPALTAAAIVTGFVLGASQVPTPDPCEMSSMERISSYGPTFGFYLDNQCRE